MGLSYLWDDGFKRRIKFMDLELKGEFSERLGKYFGEQEFPIVLYYINDVLSINLNMPYSDSENKEVSYG